MLPKANKIKQPKQKSADEALQSLMRLCARAERSSGDALRLMARWGVPSTERPKVLKRLIDERFIDDRRYADAFIREKINLSAWGEYKIKATLRTKGIDERTISEALSEATSLNSTERLNERLQRKLRTTKAPTAYQLKAKLIRYGASLGYPMDAVIECVESLMNDLNIDSECDLD